MTIFSGGTFGPPWNSPPLPSSPLVPPRGSTALSVEMSGLGLGQGLFKSADVAVGLLGVSGKGFLLVSEEPPPPPPVEMPANPFCAAVDDGKLP